MTLTSATQLTSRAHGVRRASLGAAVAVVCHPQQQVRGFRFGRLWSSYFDPEFSRNDCRRQRHLRYKYAETLSRRLSWDQNSAASGDAKPHVLKNCWNPNGIDNGDGGKSANMRAPQKTPDNPEGIRPGQNIEDAERAPLEDLLFGHHHEQQTQWEGQDLPRKSFKQKKNRRGHNHGTKIYETEGDYIIDPITNRKVLKSKGVDLPDRSIGSYRSQFAEFTAPNAADTQAPIFYDGPPPESELKKYSQVNLDKTPWDSVSNPTTGDRPASIGGSSLDASNSGADLLNAIAWRHQDVFWHHKDGATSAKVGALGPDISEYTDLHKYRPVLDEEPPSVDQQSDTQYGDLDKYRTVKYQEPDGAPTEQELPHKYEDLVDYNAVKSHEPDGKYRTSEDGNEQKYQDLDKYGPIEEHEPDGKYQEMQQASEQQYEDLDRYDSVRSHEPDGKYKAEQDSSIHQYEDLGEYGPVKAHEPDGKYKAQVDAAVASEVDPEELSKYEAFRSHEPDGLYAASHVKPIPDAEELAQYKPFRSHEPDGKYATNHESGTEDRVEETRYQAFRSHEPDGKYAPSSQVDPSVEYADLDTYGPFRSHEPDGRYAVEQSESVNQPEELGQYQAVRSHEPDGKYAAQSESCTEVPDLGNHEAFGYEDSETKTPPPSHDIGADLKEYKTVQNNELDGQTASPSQEQDNGPAATLEEQASMSDSTPEQHGIDNSIVGTRSESRLVASNNSEKSEYRKLQESLMSEAATEDSAVTPPGNPVLDSVNEIPDSSERLTGNYVRDFPDDFTQSWTSTGSAKDSPLLPSDWSLPIEDGTRGQDVVSRSPAALETALDRHQKPGRSLAAEIPSALDPYSKEPQGLETSYVQECGEEVPVFATIYGTAHPDTESTTSPSSPATEAPLENTIPTVYKVLVYNPASQCVESAETTSIVPDTSTPLTPAEVLLKISNPSKFIPHFAPLQTQGYEIVSGGGDVLIFRKVREAAPTSPDHPDSLPTAAEDGESSTISYSPPPINPIDMTGGGLRDIDVAASRFASPTGFVNYDLPPLHYEPTSSYLPSHGVESKFGGLGGSSASEQPSSETSGKSGRKDSKSLPKQLVVGALWVGGLSYSLAVVGDYFQTGGTDGKGTRGRL